MQEHCAGDSPAPAKTPGGNSECQAFLEVRGWTLFLSTIQSLVQSSRHFLPWGGRRVLNLKGRALKRKVEL